MKHRTALLLVLSLVAGRGGLGAETGAGELWSAKVQPLFDVQCVKCHGLIERKGGLELDSPEAVMKGGDEGPVVVPGEPEKSRLYQYLAADSDPHMPPKKQLSEAERETVRAWILSLTAQPSRPGAGTSAPREFGTVNQAIDVLVSDGWARRGVRPTSPVEDRAWCRRVYLDLAGRIPTAQELEAFLDSSVNLRREALVDHLLASDAYPVRMRELWDVFLMGRVKRDNHEDRRRQNGWWSFLEESFRSNRPWNEVVRAMLVARPDRAEDRGASWFLYERRNDHQVMAEAVAPVIYGAKIDCAQCHDHPLAREIKQAHYWGLVAAFNRSKNVDGGAELAESAVGGFVNFTNLKKESQPALVTLLSGKTLAEERPAGDAKEEDADDKYLDAKAKVRVPRYSRREAFAEAATRDNPLLARAFVNRAWSVFIGRGLVHPADEMTARNVPSHPELLDWLAGDFVVHGHDVRRLIRGIVLSRVYGLSVGDGPPEALAGAVERPLTAEQLARSWRVAAGLAADDDGLRRAVVAKIPEVLPREYGATVQQAQFLTHSPVLATVLKSGPGSEMARWAALPDDGSRVRGAFLGVLGRLPDAEEAAPFELFLASRRERPVDGLRDMTWALMTSAEFLTLP